MRLSDGIDLLLGPEVPPRACSPSETTATASWRSDWSETIEQAIRDNDGWGVIIRRPNGSLWLFGVGEVTAATAGGGTAWVIVHRETGR